jgi:UDP-glucose 4-epimerase
VRAPSLNEYVTLFDAHYLPRGLVLYESLRRVCPDFRLRVLCMDEATKVLLDRLLLPSLVTIALEELEHHDRELAASRRSRSRVEYYWTATAPLCLYCLEREQDLGLITYLDADVAFYADPAPIFDELGNASVLLTPHRYARRWEWLERDSGRYNVQLVTFRRTPEAIGALRWWRERCIEWCYDRVEKGKFGDQRYLDDWPERFPGVRVLEHPGGGLGPWSSGRFEFDSRGGSVLVDDKPLLFHHFHGLRLHRPGRLSGGVGRGHTVRIGASEAAWSPDFPLTRFELEQIWQPYVAQVALQTERVLSLAPELQHELSPTRPAGRARRLALRAPRPLPELTSRALHAISSRGRSGIDLGDPDPDGAVGGAADPAIEALRDARIVVLGGLGFIGSNLARELVDAGAEVALLDSLRPQQGGRLDNVAGLESRLTLEIGDVRDDRALVPLLKRADVVFNLVGQTSHLDSMISPVTDLESNCESQLAILEALRRHNPSARVVYAGTRQIYGRPHYLPVDERHPVCPVDVNGIHKFAAAEYHRLYEEVYGLDVTILRLTNTYGPRMRVSDARQTFLGEWIRRALRGQDVLVYGDGSQRRDLNYIDDVVDAFARAALSPRSASRVYNLGSSRVVTLLELAELVTTIAASGTVRCVPFPRDRKAIDIGDYFADFSLIRQELDWSPQVELEEGLHRTIQFFRGHRGS